MSKKQRRGKTPNSITATHRVSAQALNSTARAVAGDLFGVDPYMVRVFLQG